MAVTIAAYLYICAISSALMLPSGAKQVKYAQFIDVLTFKLSSYRCTTGQTKSIYLQDVHGKVKYSIDCSQYTKTIQFLTHFNFSFYGCHFQTTKLMD